MGEEYIKAFYYIIWILFLSSFLFYNEKKEIIKSGKYLLIWLLIFSVIIAIYSYKDIFLNNRVVSSLIPGYGYKSDNKLTYIKSKDNHFYINATVNNQNIKFMVDTGASSIILNKKDAVKIGIDLQNLTYDRAFSTANGVIYCATVKLPYLKIKDLLLEDIYVAINPSDSNISLLGMSFLQYFYKYEFNQDSLTLYY